MRARNYDQTKTVLTVELFISVGSLNVGTFGANRPLRRSSPGAGVTRTGASRPLVLPSAMPVPALARPAAQSTQIPGPSQAKRARKDRGPNWLPTEVFALISAKREMYLEELDTVDGRDLMTPETRKWDRIAHQIMQLGVSPCMRDGAACKTKWNQLIPDYRKISDSLNRSDLNNADYWEMNSSERKGEGLPRLFAQDVYIAINE